MSLIQCTKGILNLSMTYKKPNYAFATHNTKGKKAFENILRKGEDAGDQHILLYQKMFCFLFKTNQIITKRDHTPQQLLVTKQINVTGMQDKKFHERAITQ